MMIIEKVKRDSLQKFFFFFSFMFIEKVRYSLGYSYFTKTTFHIVAFSCIIVGKCYTFEDLFKKWEKKQIFSLLFEL